MFAGLFKSLGSMFSSPTTVQGLTKAGKNSGKLAMATSGISALLDLVSSGLATSANQTAGNYEAEQYRIRQAEDLREADKVIKDAKDFADYQAMAFRQSGVLATEGSPLLVMETTRQKALDQANAYRDRAAAYSRIAQGVKAKTKGDNRAALFGAVAKGASGILSTYLQGKRYNLFGSSSGTGSTNLFKQPGIVTGAATQAGTP